jgi:hypothetical protein
MDNQRVQPTCCYNEKTAIFRHEAVSNESEILMVRLHRTILSRIKIKSAIFDKERSSKLTGAKFTKESVLIDNLFV